jgi:hypothetical protein
MPKPSAILFRLIHFAMPYMHEIKSEKILVKDTFFAIWFRCAFAPVIP